MIGYYFRVLFTHHSRLGVSKGGLRGDISGAVWSVYLSDAERRDEALAENLKGDAEGILFFVCL